MPDEIPRENTRPPRFRYVAVGPWAGWTEAEINREIFGGAARVIPPPPDDDEDE